LDYIQALTLKYAQNTRKPKCYHLKGVENKGNVKHETDVNESAEYRKKIYVHYKKEQIMIDTNEPKKAEAL